MKRILLVKLGAIGDVVMAIPALHALQASGHQIDWVVCSVAATVLECYSVCRVIPADESAIVRGSLGERIAPLRAIWTLLASSYDVIVTLYYDRRHRLISLSVCAAHHVRLDSTNRMYTLQTERHYTDEFSRILFAGIQNDVVDASLKAQSLAPVPPGWLPCSPLSV